MVTEENNNELWRVFYISYGEKWFIAELNKNGRLSSSITKKDDNFKTDCIKVNFETAKEIISNNRSVDEIWGMVNDNGKQLVLNKFDNLYK